MAPPTPGAMSEQDSECMAPLAPRRQHHSLRGARRIRQKSRFHSSLGPLSRADGFSEELLIDGRDNGPSLLLTFADCVAWHGTTEPACYFCWQCPRFHWGCVLCRCDDNCSDDYIAIDAFYGHFETKKGPLISRRTVYDQ